MKASFDHLPTSQISHGLKIFWCIHLKFPFHLRIQWVVCRSWWYKHEGPLSSLKCLFWAARLNSQMVSNGNWSTLRGWCRNPKWDIPNFIMKQFLFMLFEYSNYPTEQFRRGLTLKQSQENVHHTKVNKGSPYVWKQLPQPLSRLRQKFLHVLTSGSQP